MGSTITADGDWNHEIKRYLVLERKVMTNLDSILKSKDITLPTKVRLVKAMVFPVVMCGYESWTIKKAEYRRIDAFELWCWRRLLRVPWTARRSNQSILKKIIPECSWSFSFNINGRTDVEAGTPILLLQEGDPFQGPKLGSCLTLRNELSEETHVLINKRFYWERALGWRAGG